jgi:hypothetical protein
VRLVAHAAGAGAGSSLQAHANRGKHKSAHVS